MKKESNLKCLNAHNAIFSHKMKHTLMSMLAKCMQTSQPVHSASKRWIVTLLLENIVKQITLK